MLVCWTSLLTCVVNLLSYLIKVIAEMASYALNWISAYFLIIIIVVFFNVFDIICPLFPQQCLVCIYISIILEQLVISNTLLKVYVWFAQVSLYCIQSFETE